MKKITTIIITLLIFTSCQNSAKDKKDTAANETPEVFQEHTVLEDVASYSKRGRYQSLTEKLYNELIEKDVELKEIENQISKLEEEHFKTNIENNNFLENNAKYYRELKPFLNDSSNINMKFYISEIGDSTLREKMISIVSESEKKYTSKVKKLIGLKTNLNNKIYEMQDYKKAMKITLTLKSIENYQDNYKQDTTSIKELINKYEVLTNTIKNKIKNQ